MIVCIVIQVITRATSARMTTSGIRIMTLSAVTVNGQRSTIHGQRPTVNSRRSTANDRR